MINFFRCRYRLGASASLLAIIVLAQCGGKQTKVTIQTQEQEIAALNRDLNESRALANTHRNQVNNERERLKFTEERLRFSEEKTQALTEDYQNLRTLMGPLRQELNKVQTELTRVENADKRVLLQQITNLEATLKTFERTTRETEELLKQNARESEKAAYNRGIVELLNAIEVRGYSSQTKGILFTTHTYTFEIKRKGGNPWISHTVVTRKAENPLTRVLATAVDLIQLKQVFGF